MYMPTHSFYSHCKRPQIFRVFLSFSITLSSPPNRTSHTPPPFPLYFSSQFSPPPPLSLASSLLQNGILYQYTGGDISYHLEKQGRFTLARVRLYVAELSLALEYLREHLVIHRDVKPANMLLDSGGHVHLTDFNVACIVRPGVAITSVTGTKPYMGQ